MDIFAIVLWVQIQNPYGSRPPPPSIIENKAADLETSQNPPDLATHTKIKRLWQPHGLWHEMNEDQESHRLITEYRHHANTHRRIED